MQWDGTKFGGFSSVNPWLPLEANFREDNVENSRNAKCSLYWLYRRLINLRRTHVVIAEGAYKPVVASGDLLLFLRELRDNRLLVALNFGSEPIAVLFDEERLSGCVLVSSFADRDGQEVTGSIDLRGNEGLVLKVDTGPIRELENRK